MCPRIPASHEPGDNEPADPTENLPEGTRRVINQHGELMAAIREEWADAAADLFDDNLDADEWPSHVVFEEGDVIPRPLAGLVYDAFGDTLECQDGNGATIDPATAESTGTTYPR